MLMISRRATLIIAGFAGNLGLLPGCASVKSTAAYFTPTSTKFIRPNHSMPDTDSENLSQARIRSYRKADP
jgi:hypothetical protein